MLGGLEDEREQQQAQMAPAAPSQQSQRPDAAVQPQAYQAPTSTPTPDAAQTASPSAQGAAPAGSIATQPGAGQQSPWAQPMGAMPNRGPSGWVNFQEYMGLNAGGGQQMASKLAGQVQKQGQQAKDDIGLAAHQATQRVHSSPWALSDEGGLANTADTQLGDQLAGSAKEAATAAKDLNTEAGRAGMVRQTYSKLGTYTPGMSAFDLFLMGNGNDGGQFAATADRFGGLETYLADTQKKVDDYSASMHRAYQGRVADRRTRDAAAAAKAAEREKTVTQVAAGREVKKKTGGHSFNGMK